MSKAKFLGSVFGHEEGGYQYNVSFQCIEAVDSETGIEYADIVEIKVTDRIGIDGSKQVDMEKLTEICQQKAIEALSKQIRPDMNSN